MGIAIALAGNPNSGKTTLFNVLTGARQHVGNYPGVTVAKKRGIDIAKLSSLLGLPVVPMVARIGKGRDDLLKTVADHAETRTKSLKISYGRDIDEALDEMVEKISSAHFLTDRYLPRWVALKYLENDVQILEMGKEQNPQMDAWLSSVARKLTHHLDTTLDTHPEGMIADQRYGFITSILKQGVMTHTLDKNRMETSDKIDKIVTHRFLGPMLMVAVLMGLYQFTFAYSAVPVGWCENFFGWLAGRVDGLFSDGLLKSLVISGIIDGVGGVLGFVPLIMFMFLGISFLEDTGYLARMAFMLDRVFRLFGLHGASVMAFIVSGGIAGGCAVPGVMAARTLKSPKERLATLLTVPFMNCGAKLPVYALLVAAFFSENQARVMFIITLISWVGALLVAKLLRSTVIQGPATPFVMELPPYRLPTFKGLAIHTWERPWSL